MSLKWVVKHHQVTQAIESINLSYPQTLEIFSKSIHYNRPQSNSQAQTSHGRSINSHMNKKKIKVSMATSDIIAVGIGVFGVIFLYLIITGNI